METKEFSFNGTVLNGFLMLFVTLGLMVASIVLIILSIIALDESNGAQGGWMLGGSVVLLVADIIAMC